MADVPQWLRFVSFLTAASIALTPFLIGARKIGFGWLLALFWGAVSLYSIRLVQIPIQSVITSAMIGSNLPQWARTAFYIFPSGLVQEIAKWILPGTFLMLGVKLGTSEKLYGPAAGAGFGIAEAVWLVGLHSSAIGWVAVVERFTAILFHTGATALAVGGGKPKRMIWGLPLAILLHSLYNYIAITYMNKVNIWTLELIIGVMSLILWGFAIIISKEKEER
ncbi:MAG: YhfC family glutamic-type intramembrane protease [bacterium]